MAKLSKKPSENQANVAKIVPKNTTAGKSEASDPKRSAPLSADQIAAYLTSLLIPDAVSGNSFSALSKLLHPALYFQHPALYLLELKIKAFKKRKRIKKRNNRVAEDLVNTLAGLTVTGAKSKP